jgi:hypothetical protein
VTVDLMGMKPYARVNATVTVEPPPLPEAHSAPLPAARTVSRAPSSLAQVRAERPPQAATDSGEVWDVFISHAGEDKSAVVRPLRDALEAFGVKVWFDAFELGIGDAFDARLTRASPAAPSASSSSRPPSSRRAGPQYELDGIVTRSVAGSRASCRSGTRSRETR